MTENQLITMRLRHIFEERGVSTDEANLSRWAQAYGLNPSTFLNQFRTHTYTLHTIQVLNVALHDVSADYLLYGIGYAYRDPKMVHVVNTVTGNSVSVAGPGSVQADSVAGSGSVIADNVAGSGSVIADSVDTSQCAGISDTLTKRED